MGLETIFTQKLQVYTFHKCLQRNVMYNELNMKLWSRKTNIYLVFS